MDSLSNAALYNWSKTLPSLWTIKIASGGYKVFLTACNPLYVFKSHIQARTVVQYQHKMHIDWQANPTWLN